MALDGFQVGAFFSQPDYVLYLGNWYRLACVRGIRLIETEQASPSSVPYAGSHLVNRSEGSFSHQFLYLIDAVQFLTRPATGILRCISAALAVGIFYK